MFRKDIDPWVTSIEPYPLDNRTVVVGYSPEYGLIVSISSGEPTDLQHLERLAVEAGERLKYSNEKIRGAYSSLNPEWELLAEKYRKSSKKQPILLKDQIVEPIGIPPKKSSN